MEKQLTQSLPLFLIITLILPSWVRAQDAILEPIKEVVSNTASVEPEEIDNEPSSEPIPAPVVQETINSDLLEEAVNPQAESQLEEAIEVIDESTEERLEEEIIIEDSATTTEPVIDILPAEEEIVEIIETATTTEVLTLDIADLEPKKEYTFAINGASIATEETPEWVTEAKGDEENDSAADDNNNDKVTEAPGISIQDSSHLLNITGACADNYYVILIYKDPEGYNINPSSYIYNRAFPCENGQYSYALSELPFDLESGTFYLLVAGQGHAGPWKPISAMIPIGITVKTILPAVPEITDPVLIPANNESE